MEILKCIGIAILITAILSVIGLSFAAISVLFGDIVAVTVLFFFIILAIVHHVRNS